MPFSTMLWDQKHPKMPITLSKLSDQSNLAYVIQDKLPCISKLKSLAKKQCKYEPGEVAPFTFLYNFHYTLIDMS